jgi:hypothetical protein
LTSSDGQADLPGDYTFTSADAGQHTFSATLKTAGLQSITATDTVSSDITGTQGGIQVNPAAAARLVVAGFPSPAQRMVSYSFTVTAVDLYGNVATGYTGTVHFSTDAMSADLPDDYTFTAADAGTHTFFAAFNRFGTFYLRAVDMDSGIFGQQSDISVPNGGG